MPTQTAPTTLAATVLCDGHAHEVTITTDCTAALAVVNGTRGLATDAVLVKAHGLYEVACPGEEGRECHGYATAAPADFDFDLTAHVDLSGAALLEHE